MGPRRDRVVSLLAAIPEGFRVRKIPRGDFTCWMLYKGRKRVGHITGFERAEGEGSLRKQEGLLDIVKTEIDEEFRGNGVYRQFLQYVSTQYPFGVRSAKYQTSKMFQKSLRTQPDYTENGEFHHVGFPRTSGRHNDTPVEAKQRAAIIDHLTTVFHLDQSQFLASYFESYTDNQALFRFLVSENREFQLYNVFGGFYSDGDRFSVTVARRSSSVNEILKTIDLKVGRSMRTQVMRWLEKHQDVDYRPNEIIPEDFYS